MYLINEKNEKNEAIPIPHKCIEADIGKPLTEEELHEFAVELVMVYHYKQGVDIKSMNIEPGLDHPHIIMVNKENNKLHYVTIKADYSPNIPKPLAKEYYSSLIKLAREAEAVPVFIGVVFHHIPQDGQSDILCEDKFIVEYTGLIQI